MRMLGSFWWHSQYGTLDPEDTPNCPTELNPYKRLLIRWAFADMKAIALLIGGVLFGLLCWLLSDLAGFPILP